MDTYIVGTGRSLPERVITNEELGRALGVDFAWIEKNTGIRARRWADGSQASSDFGVQAAERAIEKAQLSRGAIDYLIAGTMTPDFQIPGVAPLIQERLGLNQIPSLDIRAACCNPLYGFELASALIHSDRARNVLVVGAETQSKGLKLAPEAKDISSLFGDGAGACVISGAARLGAIKLIDVCLFTDGKFAKDLAVLGPGSGNGTRWFDEDPAHRELYYPVMNGRSVILHAARKLTEAARAVLDRRGWSSHDIDLVIPHQANANLLLAVARHLELPSSKLVSVLEWSGNTSSASMLIALDWAYEQRAIRSGEHVLFLAFGAGFAWGAALGEGV